MLLLKVNRVIKGQFSLVWSFGISNRGGDEYERKQVKFSS